MDNTPIDSALVEQATSVPEADELTQVFEEQVTGDAELPDATQMDALQEIGVGLEWLNDLRYTISKEGVSSDDMRALHSIREKVKAHGIELAAAPSLETYGVASYTQVRSPLNLSVSNEGITQTIIEMIKQWIKSFKEWLIKTIRVVRNYQHLDAQVKAKLDKVIEQLDQIRSATLDLRKIAPEADNHVEQLNPFAKSLLLNPKLKRNLVTAALMGDAFRWSDLLLIQKDAISQVARLKRAIDDFQRFIKGDVDQPLVDPTIASFLKEVTRRAADFQMEQPDKNFLVDKNDNAFHETFEAPLIKDQKDFVSYEFLITAYTEVAEFLRAANNVRAGIDETDQSTYVTQAITTINECYLELYKLIEFFSNVRRCQLAVINAYYQYWNRAYSLAFSDMDANALVSEALRRTHQKMRDKFNSSLRTAGVV